MRPDASKNRKLIRQYPFVTWIMAKQMEPFGPTNNQQRIDDLTIKVERADGNLMFRRAANTGLGENSAIFEMKGPRAGQVMRRGEYMFAVDRLNYVINRLDFPRNEKETREKNVYAGNVLWGTKSNGRYNNPIFDEVGYLVWVTVDAWHKDTRDDYLPEGRFGEFVSRALTITIYRAPAEGFRKLHERANIWDNLYLDERLLNRALAERNIELIQITGCLWELCKLFQDEVYSNGMKAAFEAGEFRGASGQFGATKVLVAELCDYHRVTIENGSCWITFQLRPEAQDMVVHAEGGTLPQLRQLVRGVVKMWNEQPTCRANFKPDKNVSVM